MPIAVAVSAFTELVGTRWDGHGHCYWPSPAGLYFLFSIFCVRVYVYRLFIVCMWGGITYTPAYTFSHSMALSHADTYTFHIV
jgi:hypothetical protein